MGTGYTLCCGIQETVEIICAIFTLPLWVKLALKKTTTRKRGREKYDLYLLHCFLDSVCCCRSMSVIITFWTAWVPWEICDFHGWYVLPCDITAVKWQNLLWHYVYAVVFVFTAVLSEVPGNQIAAGHVNFIVVDFSGSPQLFSPSSPILPPCLQAWTPARM